MSNIVTSVHSYKHSRPSASNIQHLHEKICSSIFSCLRIAALVLGDWSRTNWVDLIYVKLWPCVLNDVISFVATKAVAPSWYQVLPIWPVVTDTVPVEVIDVYYISRISVKMTCHYWRHCNALVIQRNTWVQNRHSYKIWWIHAISPSLSLSLCLSLPFWLLHMVKLRLHWRQGKCYSKLYQ